MGIDPNIIVALIGGGVTIFCTVLTVHAGMVKAQNLMQESIREVKSALEKYQALTDQKIEELTREVRIHNSFAQKIPVIEKEIESLKEQIKRLEDK